MPPERLRLQLDLDDVTNERIEAVKAASGARSNAEAVRNALRIYAWFTSHQKSGRKLLTAHGLRPDGTWADIHEIELLL